MTRGDLGRAKIQGILATVGEMVVGGAPRVGQGDGAKATKAKQVRHVGGGAR